MYKKFISAALSAALLAWAAYAPALAKDEKVTLIVETEGAPLLETKNAVNIGASEFMKTDEAKREEKRILSVQSQIKSGIETRVKADVDSGFTYTSVINGFSVEARKSDIEKIKAVGGVKNIYISKAHKITPELTSDGESEPGFGARMMNV